LAAIPDIVAQIGTVKQAVQQLQVSTAFSVEIKDIAELNKVRENYKALGKDARLAAQAKVAKDQQEASNELKAVAALLGKLMRSIASLKQGNDAGLSVKYRAGKPVHVRFVTLVNKKIVPIYGTPQIDATPGHASTVLNKALELAKSGQYDYVTMDLAWRTALYDVALRIPLTEARTRPDVIGVTTKGTVVAREVQSLTDQKRNIDLAGRLDEVFNKLQPDRKGEIGVIKLPYPS
jgi:hypothetical protein